MINKNLKLLGVSFILTAFTTSYPAAFAADNLIAYTQTSSSKIAAKPVLRNNTSSKMKLQGEISITKTNPKINLTLRNTDVQQVLRMFADKAGLNIIFHNSANGKVTLDLVNVPLNDAFKLVMQVSNFSYYIDGKTMVVTSANVAKTLNMSKQAMATIPVNYIDASAIADFLNNNIFAINSPGLSNSEIVVTNPAENELLIFGTDNDILMAQKIVNKFDIPPRETTFTVNHTTPKEMANLVCSMLLNSTGKNSSTNNSSSGGMQQSVGSPVIPAGSGVGSPVSPAGSGVGSPVSPLNTPSNIPGIMTGGASSSGGSSSGSSSSGGNSSSNIIIGQNVIACKINNKASTKSLTSFNIQSLAVSYFPQRGTINVLGGSARQVQMIKDFITKNDVKQPQAYLDVSIIELTETGSREFNNYWNINSKYFTASFVGDSGITRINPIIIGPFDGRPTGSPNLKWELSYLMSNRKGRVLANPKIIITNGQESIIDMTSDYVESVDAEIITNTSGGYSGVERTYNIGDEEGIKISMIPFISPEGYVTLNINPHYAVEKDQIEADVTGRGNIELVATLLTRRNLDLKNIRIKDGETLILGGLIQEIQTKSVYKIPFLGDIPYIGTIFRSSIDDKEKSELVIMITPRIIRDSEDLVNHQQYNEDTL